MSILLSPTGAGGAQYTVGAAWMIDGVGLMGGRGPCTVDGSGTMETISETCRKTLTELLRLHQNVHKHASVNQTVTVIKSDVYSHIRRMEDCSF